ncbi:NADH-quinone oxidoreductase subunit H [Pendulispora brunnea]|uniref:NADH-quinone oxidoreductase subunit H n=1 Tax=Pendulispora brunnea TaxID=2905690 RepID=A0ABZ2K0V0_9BACT
MSAPTVHTLIHILMTALLPPLLLGVITKTKAAFAGRVGAPFLQPYYDLARLFRKGSVFSTTTTWLFRVSPIVGVVTAALASLLIPLGNHAAPVSFTGDLVFFAYLFGLARFFTVSAALDTGSAFEGMGGAREATFSCLAEPALFLGFLVLVKQSGSLSLGTMLSASTGSSGTGASIVLVLASLFIVLLAENCRIPFDDPNTHLELTMIHEVMVLDHSGPAFGLILYGAALKLFVLGAVVVELAIPGSTGNAWGDWGVFLAGMLVLSVVIGVVESVMARLRLRQVPSLLVAACLLSGFGIILLAR